MKRGSGCKNGEGYVCRVDNARDGLRGRHRFVETNLLVEQYIVRAAVKLAMSCGFPRVESTHHGGGEERELNLQHLEGE